MEMKLKLSVIECLKKGGEIAKTQKIARRTGQSGASVGKAFSELKKEGIVQKVGNRKWMVNHQKLNIAYPEAVL